MRPPPARGRTPLGTLRMTTCSEGDPSASQDSLVWEVGDFRQPPPQSPHPPLCDQGGPLHSFTKPAVAPSCLKFFSIFLLMALDKVQTPDMAKKVLGTRPCHSSSPFSQPQKSFCGPPTDPSSLSPLHSCQEPLSPGTLPHLANAHSSSDHGW